MKHTVGFVTSTVFAILGSVLLLIGVAIWTVILKKAQTINSIVIEPGAVPLGINVKIGDELFIAWAAFALLTASIIPYMIRYVL